MYVLCHVIGVKNVPMMRANYPSSWEHKLQNAFQGTYLCIGRQLNRVKPQGCSVLLLFRQMRKANVDVQGCAEKIK